MSYKPFISVIVPVFNLVSYLREALDSVKLQTFEDWECICIDDGSTDGSAEILDAYARSDSRFRVLHKPNGGASSARNMGLDGARGDWICFLDGDDRLAQHLFERLAPLCQSTEEVDLVAFCQTSGTDCTLNKDSEINPVVEFNLRRHIPVRVANGGFVHKIYRRERGMGIRFKPYLMGEDRLFSAEWICCSRNIICTDYVGYWYRTREGSVTKSPLSLRKVEDEFRSAFDILSLYSQSSAEISPSVIRGETVRLSELTAYTLSRMSSEKGVSDVIMVWHEILGRASRLDRISFWYRFVLRAVSKYPLLSTVLLVVPFRAKMLRNRVSRRS